LKQRKNFSKEKMGNKKIEGLKEKKNITLFGCGESGKRTVKFFLI
jgi:hypothetical protein